MIYFDSDYMAGAHPEVMKSLEETNLIDTTGYGTDRFCESARNLILEACGLEKGSVYFLEGGTQTNATVIDRLLSRNDGVIATDTSHINVHEAGAIEAWGHKILVLPNHDGKLDPKEVERYIDEFYKDDTYPHMVRPSMVYVSFPTELGTIYSKKELEDLHDVCKKFDIPLYADGARLAYGLNAVGNDLTLQDIARLCDVFYIGGTKCGTLFGEAVVTRRPELLPRFVSVMKLHGALLAKGRLLGVQFKALFTDNLYNRIGEHAISMAMQVKKAFVEKGFRQFIESPTNQQFFILPNRVIDKLKEEVSFELWGPRGEESTPVRFVTSWNTRQEDLDILRRKLSELN